MKIFIKQYAQGLYEAMSECEAEQDIKIGIRNFLKVLESNNDLGKAEKIIKEFEMVWNREKGIVEGELMSARETGDDIVTLLNCYIVKLLGVKEVKLHTKVDKDILGGFVVKISDMVVDGSLKSNLVKLKNRLIS